MKNFEFGKYKFSNMEDFLSFSCTHRSFHAPTHRRFLDLLVTSFIIFKNNLTKKAIFIYLFYSTEIFIKFNFVIIY